MNKFDGINNMNFDSNFTSSKLIRPSFPEPNDDLNGLEYYAIFRNFWIKEFDYFRDKSIKYIIENIYSGCCQFYNIDDLLKEFCDNIINRHFINNNIDDIIYILNIYNKWKDYAFIESACVFRVSNYKELIMFNLFKSIVNFASKHNDEELKSMINQYAYGKDI